MGFIRNLITLIQRLGSIMRDGPKRGALPGTAVYRRPEGSSDTPEIEPARAPARNAGETQGRFRETVTAPLKREDYDDQPASAEPEDTAAGAMAIKERFFDGDDEDEEDGDKPAESRSAIPLPPGDEPLVQDTPDAAPAQHSDDGEEGTQEDAASDAESEQASPPPVETPAAPPPASAQQVEIIPADPRNPTPQHASQSLASPGIRLYGTMDAAMYAEFTQRLSEQAPGGPIVIALTTMDGDPDIARSMADDIRLLRDRGRREIIFLGKTAVHSAGVLFMAAFPVSQRYLTRATKLLITENRRAQPIQLAGGSLRHVASQLEHAQREIDQEDDDFRAITEGSNVSVQELREKAPGDWYITASEAKAMGLIAEVV